MNKYIVDKDGQTVFKIDELGIVTRNGSEKQPARPHSQLGAREWSINRETNQAIERAVGEAVRNILPASSGKKAADTPTGYTTEQLLAMSKSTTYGAYDRIGTKGKTSSAPKRQVYSPPVAPVSNRAPTGAERALSAGGKVMADRAAGYLAEPPRSTMSSGSAGGRDHGMTLSRSFAASPANQGAAPRLSPQAGADGTKTGAEQALSAGGRVMADRAAAYATEYLGLPGADGVTLPQEGAAEMERALSIISKQMGDRAAGNVAEYLGLAKKQSNTYVSPLGPGDLIGENPFGFNPLEVLLADKERKWQEKLDGWIERADQKMWEEKKWPTKAMREEEARLQAEEAARLQAEREAARLQEEQALQAEEAKIAELPLASSVVNVGVYTPKDRFVTIEAAAIAWAYTYYARSQSEGQEYGAVIKRDANGLYYFDNVMNALDSYNEKVDEENQVSSLELLSDTDKSKVTIDRRSGDGTVVADIHTHYYPTGNLYLSGYGSSIREDSDYLISYSYPEIEEIYLVNRKGIIVKSERDEEAKHGYTEGEYTYRID